jgi:hypothetical protein
MSKKNGKGESGNGRDLSRKKDPGGCGRSGVSESFALLRMTTKNEQQRQEQDDNEEQITMARAG